MGRPSKGPSIGWKRGCAYARFTWEGTPYYIALGTKDERAAKKAAARAYAKVVEGQHRPIKQTPGQPLDDLCTAWVESKVSSVDPSFVPTLRIYAARFVEYFSTLDGITEASATEYGLERLAVILRKTVLRELSYLRQFLTWAKLHGALAYVPLVPPLPPKAKGVRAGKQRAKSVVVTPAEAKAIIAQLPEESRRVGRRPRGDKRVHQRATVDLTKKPWPIRARFAFMWETALRPETISRLRVPENWQPGQDFLVLTDEDDKARYGRDVDLTREAVAILTRTAPDEGLVFGSHTYTKHLKRAAAAVLGPVRAKSFAPYDFRHNRAKERLDAGASLRGVAYMLGHRKVSTTDKYLAPDRAAGREALEAGGRKKRTRVEK